MRVTTGIDIIEISRIKENIEKNNKFLDRVFTSNEIEYCESSVNKYERYAARFAAKEAVYKALNVDGISSAWHDIEVLLKANGRPYIHITGELEIFNKDIENIDISISHIKEIAAASVVISWK